MNRTIERKIAKLEGDIYRKSIKPPAALVPYLNGKQFENEEEGRKVQKMYNDWLVRIERAIKSNVGLDEILDVLPEPYRTRVVEALIKSIPRDEP